MAISFCIRKIILAIVIFLHESYGLSKLAFLMFLKHNTLDGGFSEPLHNCYSQNTVLPHLQFLKSLIYFKIQLKDHLQHETFLYPARFWCPPTTAPTSHQRERKRLRLPCILCDVYMLSLLKRQKFFQGRSCLCHSSTLGSQTFKCRIREAQLDSSSFKNAIGLQA